MKISNRTLVTIGMFAAVLSVLSILSVPMPSGVPITLQTFAVALCGYVLGAKRGTATVLIYILLGTVGIPVFSGMHGGISWLVSYTGGFLWGFIFLAMLCGMAMRKQHMALRIVLSGIGLMMCHMAGMIQFAVVADTAIEEAFVAVSAPYLIKDVISLVGAYAVATPIRRTIHINESSNEKGICI